VFLEFHFLRIWAHFSSLKRIIFFFLRHNAGTIFRGRVARFSAQGEAPPTGPYYVISCHHWQFSRIIEPRRIV
jgi:hypothetical protein